MAYLLQALVVWFDVVHGTGKRDTDVCTCIALEAVPYTLLAVVAKQWSTKGLSMMTRTPVCSSGRLKTTGSQCVFLQEDRSCKIWKARPVQCRKLSLLIPNAACIGLGVTVGTSFPILCLLLSY